MDNTEVKPKKEKKTRGLSLEKLLAIKVPKFDFDGVFKRVFGGDPNRTGMWLIYGAPKHGKSTFTILLVNYLLRFEKVLYIAAEEGEDGLKEIISRHLPEPKFRNKIIVKGQLDWEQTLKEIRTHRSKIIVIDNLTMYDGLRKSAITELKREFDGKKLLIFVAHENDKKQPNTIAGKQVLAFAKVIAHVEGLRATITHRGAQGGFFHILEKRSKLIYGDDAIEIDNDHETNE